MAVIATAAPTFAGTSPNPARHCAAETVKKALTESDSELIIVDDSERFHHLRVDGYSGTETWASVVAAADDANSKSEPVFVYVGPGNRTQGRNQMRLWFERCLSVSADRPHS